MLMCPGKSREASSRQGVAFTLVELLVVVAIIALLVGILLPAVGMAIKVAANVRSSARVAALGGGCIIYHNTHECYPGQRYSGELEGSSPAGPFTGSQVLGVCLFGQVGKYSYSDIDSGPVDDSAQSVYAPLKRDKTFGNSRDDLQTIGGQKNSIWDRNTTDSVPMAILYYPARLGVSGLAQYKSADNSDYITGQTTGPESKTFDEFKEDNRFGQSDTPYGSEKFLIIAAGKDRLYFTPDDITYPTFGGE